MKPSAGAAVSVGRRRRDVAAAAVTLWRFSRPHTIAGTTISVLALAVIAAHFDHAPGAVSLSATLLAAWLVNLAIVGLNQVEDVEIDRINKPQLPLPAGALSPRAATATVAAAAVIALAMAATQGPIELIAVASALLVGFAYSSPPLRLKRYPALAMASISLVRAFAVNLGVYGHFAGSLEDLPAVIWALTAFTIPFAAAIAVLKDVPDVRGDRAFRIMTFSVRLGPKASFTLALCGLSVAYLAMAALAPALEVNVAIFSVGHLAALAALLWWSRRAAPDDEVAFTRFYMRVWLLFFIEYALVAAAVVV
jgi:homogentisate phytyltransferase / homogentisate geranylgeranyltransferase